MSVNMSGLFKKSCFHPFSISLSFFQSLTASRLQLLMRYYDKMIRSDKPWIYLKDYMNSDIPLEMVAIVLLATYYCNLTLKRGIGLVYVMVDFTYMGFLELWGT